MTKVKIYKNSKGDILKFVVSGHSEYSEKGKDIICAAISTLSQTALIALKEVCSIEEQLIDYKIGDGFLRVSLPKNLEYEEMHDANIVLKTMEVGILEISKEYSDYVTLEYGEV